MLKSRSPGPLRRFAITGLVTKLVFLFVFATILVAVNCTTDARQNLTQDAISIAKIDHWIEQLSSEKPLVRESAKANLQRAGSAAYGQLDHNRGTGSLESQLLIQELLQQINFSWTDSTDLPAVTNLMFEFAERKAADRIAIVDQLAILPTEYSWNALIKIVQFDREPNVANYAAKACLQILFVRDGSTKETAIQFVKKKQLNRFRIHLESIAAIERDSVRAVTFVFYLATKLEPIVKKEVNNNSNTEKVRSAGGNSLSENRLITNLLASFPNSLRKPVLQASYELCGQSPDAAKFLDQRCLETSISDRIELLESMAEVFFGAGRFDSIIELFKTNPDLLERKWIMPFVLAESHFRRGENQLANEIISWVIGETSPFDAEKRRLPLLNAILLESNGMIFSAEASLSSGNQEKSTPAHLRLASLEIQVGKLSSAYDRLQNVLEFPQISTATRAEGYRLLSEIASANRDDQQQADWLKKALKIDPANADNAVRLYLTAKRLSDDERKMAQQKIDVCLGIQRDRNRKAAEQARSSAPAERGIGAQNAQRSSNALAWLLVNTSDDFDAALDFAKRAAVLPTRDSSILDTLAFCYFKSGNRKAAIIAQRQAVFMKPFDKKYRQRLRQYEGR